MAVAEKISFCQVDAHLDTNPKIRMAGRDGREVFEFVLRRVALMQTNGSVPIRYLDEKYLADMLMMTCDEARHGTSQAVGANLLAIDEGMGMVFVVGWSDEWGRKAKPGSVRTAAWRDRNKAKPLKPCDAVTIGDDASSHVTVGDESDAFRSEKKRLDKDGPPPRAVAPGSDSVGLQKLKSAVDRGGANARRERALKVPNEAWIAADTLRDMLLAEDPGTAVGRCAWGTSIRDGTRLRWADGFRLIVERAGRTYAEIDDMLDWLFHGQSGTARFVVQSPDALREKWDRIKAARRNRAGVNATGEVRQIADL